MKFKPSILSLVLTGLTTQFQPAAAQFPAPAPNVSWGATYTSGNYWTGNAPHDSSANSADPAIIAGPGRIVLAYESSLDQFYDPAHGDDNINNHYDPFNVVLGSALPAPQDGFITGQPQVLIDRDCPDGLGNKRDCYILLGESLRQSDHSAEIAIAASSWTGQQEYGTWNTIAFDVSQNHSVYPGRIRAGSTINAVIAAADMYDWNTQSFQFSEVWIVPKAGLYPASGQRPFYRYFTGLKNADGSPAHEVVPAVSYVDSPASYLLNTYKPGSGTENRITVWQIDTTDLSNPKLSGSTMTVDPYGEPPAAAQAGSDVRITTWDEAITSAVLQANGLWATQTIGCTFDGDSAERSCVRWYQLDQTASTIVQQSTNGWLGVWVYYPSIAANSRGDATILFNASSENFDVGLYYMGRSGGDPSGTLSTIAALHAGNACFVRPNGSYYTVGGNTAISLDPSDNQSFWMFGAFATGNSQDCKANHWGTWLGRITWPASTPSSSSPQVVNSATLTSGPVAPGSLISIFGTNFASTAQAAAAVPLTTNLAGVSVSANGIALPLLYVGPTQINAQLPFEITGASMLTVTTNGVAAAPFRVNVTKTAPGIFQFSGNRAVATNSDYSLNTSSNPAKAGSFMTVYITGQGGLDNSIADGAGAPSSPLSSTSDTTTVNIGGKTANVLFSGATPGLVGVSQVNVVVPNGIPDGDNSLVVTIGGVPSNSTTVSVRN
jgi:uncharacterized protein (TIGR03437 family)